MLLWVNFQRPGLSQASFSKLPTEMQPWVFSLGF